MRSIGRENFGVAEILMVSFAISVLLLFSIPFVSDFFPAQAKEIQSLRVMATSSDRAEEALVALLEKTPEPSKRELRSMEVLVKQILNDGNLALPPGVDARVGNSQ